MGLKDTATILKSLANLGFSLIYIQTELIKKLKVSNSIIRELNIINYFEISDIYYRDQDIELKSNIFDTKQTFLFKIHTNLLGRNFLNSFKNK